MATNVDVTSVTGTGAVGTVVVSIRVAVTGVAGTGAVGTVFVWGQIDTSQTPAWTVIGT